MKVKGNLPRRVPNLQEGTKAGNELQFAAQNGDFFKVLHLLDEAQTPIDEQGLNNKTLLITATITGREDLVHLALARGASLHARDIDFHTPLHHAVRRKQPGIARALLDAGASLERKDGRGKTPLHRATDETLRQLLRQYHKAAQLNPEEVTKEALFAKNEDGLCPLDNPKTWQRWDELTHALAKRGESITKADLMQTDKDGKTWLERAVECRVFDRVSTSLAAKGDALNMDDFMPDGSSPSPWLQRLGETQQLGQFFTMEVWRGQNVEDMKTLLNTVPEPFRYQVPNQHALVAGLQQSARLEAGRQR